jgi:hypothetical protein
LKTSHALSSAVIESLSAQLLRRMV